MSTTSPLVLDAPSLERTRAIAIAVARITQAGDLIGLVGELGAGKTQFVRGLAEGLQINPDHVSSPTFVLMHEYAPEPDRADERVLVHIDAYRMHGPGDLASIGWGETGEELRRDAVVAVEWADLVREAMGAHWLEISLEYADHGRTITLCPHGHWATKIKILRIPPPHKA